MHGTYIGTCTPRKHFQKTNSRVQISFYAVPRPAVPLCRPCWCLAERRSLRRSHAGNTAQHPGGHQGQEDTIDERTCSPRPCFTTQQTNKATPRPPCRTKENERPTATRRREISPFRKNDGRVSRLRRHMRRFHNARTPGTSQKNTRVCKALCASQTSVGSSSRAR